MKNRLLVRGLKTGLRVVLLVYLAMLALLFFYQEKLVYQPNNPSRELTSTPADFAMAYENIQLTTADDVELHGWYIPGKSQQGVILYCHGNAGNVSHRLSTLRIFNQLGYSILIFDYRGYGQSSGETDEAGTYLDAQAAWDFLLHKKQFKPQQIIIYGRSLGGGVATELALHNPAAGLILESTFTSVPDVGAELYPFFPVRWIATVVYDNKAKVAKLSMPVLVIHSRDDNLIPYAHGRMLYELIVSKKQFFELSGGHNSGRYQNEEYPRVIDAFIRASSLPIVAE